MAALTDDGQLYVWGEYQPLSSGAPKSAPRTEPTKLEALSDFFVTTFCCSGSTLVALTSELRNRRLVAPTGTTDTPTTDGAEGRDALVVEYHRRYDTLVPKEHRISLRSNHMAQKDRLDEASLNFYITWLGETEGRAYFEGVTKAPEIVIHRPEYTKKGCQRLQVGDKVRIWMSDVYALGIVGQPPVVCLVEDDPLRRHHSSPLLPRASSSSHSQQTQPLTPRLEQAPAAGLGEELADGCHYHGRKLLVEWMRDDWVPEEVELFSDDETLDEDNPNRWQAVWFVEAPVGEGGV
jgi:hypothetical protein